MTDLFGQIENADPSRKVLVVDDSEMTRQLVSLFLTKWGCNVIEAEDGEQALEILHAERIGFVVTDWLMPRLDGTDLCREIRKADFGHYIYTILLTAKNSKEDLLEGMSSGADDFLSKPINTGELYVRVSAGMRILKLHDDMAWRNNELEAAYNAIESDLKAAARLQQTLLPDRSTSFAGASIESCYVPATHLAGDIFNYFSVGGTHVAFYGIDVSGHGVPAALLSVSISKLLTVQNAASTDGGVRPGELSAWEQKMIESPAAVIADLNNKFQTSDLDDRYFTMVYGVFDITNRKLLFAQAGHPCPLLLRSSGEAEFIGKGGMPVGMFPDIEFEDIELQLEVGDRVILYTDGITECENADGCQFGDENLVRSLRGTFHQGMDVSLSTLNEELSQWSATEEFADDVSVVALQVNPLPIKELNETNSLRMEE